MGIWSEYVREINVAEELVRYKETTPRAALDLVQRRIEKSWRRHLESVEQQRRAAAESKEEAGAGRPQPANDSSQS
ncbi:MAG: hypothetical protein ACREIA_22420 [Opitutaceae bacterium]